VKASEITRIIGGGLQADLMLGDVIAEVRQRYNLYFVLPGGASHGRDTGMVDFWNRHVGADHVLRLQDPADTSESIALTIGLSEGTINPQQGVEHLQKRGVIANTINRITGALGVLFTGVTA